MAKYALCVGINQYGNGADLHGCVNDVADLSSILAGRGFAVDTLVDSDATGANIRAALTAMVGRASYRDTVLVTYSGHGSWVPDGDGDEPDGRDEVLCPVDVWTGGVITDDELNRVFAQRRFGVRIVMLSDSCHSGSVTRFGSMPRLTDPGRGVAGAARFLPPATFLPPERVRRAHRVAELPPSGVPRPSALLLSGCRDDEYSYDAAFGGRPNGAFTRIAVDALAGLPATGTYRDWWHRIRRDLPSAEFPQTPMLYGTATQKRWPAL